MADLGMSNPARTRTTVTLAAPAMAGIFLVLATPSKTEAVAEELASLMAGTEVAARPAGPDKWLLVLERERQAEEVWANLAAGLGEHASLLDQTDGRMLIRVSGPDVREMLAKGSGTDFDPAAFPQGAAAMTAFGHVTVHVSHVADDAYELIVMTSFAASLWESLCEAALEFGCEAPHDLPGLI